MTYGLSKKVSVYTEENEFRCSSDGRLRSLHKTARADVVASNARLSSTSYRVSWGKKKKRKCRALKFREPNGRYTDVDIRRLFDVALNCPQRLFRTASSSYRKKARGR
ncbi:hypothetical protein PUN28_003525 [Cardiocondyla obscurior]|uniref:Uncharacterized protein n=1 Tax=Cardiocondyla obscurior TaxID=286306 RepID=A0AAW2GJZ4_9HYME